MNEETRTYILSHRDEESRQAVGILRVAFVITAAFYLSVVGLSARAGWRDRAAQAPQVQNVTAGLLNGARSP